MIEEGGKAIAAYMKPREDGANVKDDMAPRSVADVVKTVGHGRRILAVRPAARRSNCRPASARAYLELWANAVKRMAGEAVEPVATPDPKDKRFADPEWSQNQFFDFLKQALSAHHAVGRAAGQGRRRTRSRTRRSKAEFYVRQIANAISPSNFVLTNPELLRETMIVERARISCAACTC